MAHSPGRCLNVDYCDTADARRLVDPHMRDDAAMCPECGKPLVPPAARAPGLLLPVLAGVAAILATGIGAYAGVTVFYPARANAIPPLSSGTLAQTRAVPYLHAPVQQAPYRSPAGNSPR